MNVIFLDVDGELTYQHYNNPETADIDVEKVKLLKEICDKADAKVVISSSWKGTPDWIPPIYHTLKKILEDNNIEVLGNTPHIPVKYPNQIHGIKEGLSLDDIQSLPMKPIHGTGRAAEVQRWIKEHDVNNFVILDDEDHDWADYGFDTYWIRPTWFGDGGLKPEHGTKAVEILKHTTQKEGGICYEQTPNKEKAKKGSTAFH